MPLWTLGRAPPGGRGGRSNGILPWHGCLAFPKAGLHGEDGASAGFHAGGRCRQGPPQRARLLHCSLQGAARETAGEDLRVQLRWPAQMTGIIGLLGPVGGG